MTSSVLWLNGIAGSFGVAVLFAPGTFVHAGIQVSIVVMLLFFVTSLITLIPFATGAEVMASLLDGVHQGILRKQKPRDTGRFSLGSECEGDGARLHAGVFFHPITGVPDVCASELRRCTALTSPSKRTVRSGDADRAWQLPASAPQMAAAEAHAVVYFFLGRGALLLYDVSVIGYLLVSLFVKFTVATTITFQLLRLNTTVLDGLLPLLVRGDTAMADVGTALVSSGTATRNAILTTVVMFHVPVMLLSDKAFRRLQLWCNFAVCLGHAAVVLFFVFMWRHGAPDSGLDSMSVQINESLPGLGASSLSLRERCLLAVAAFSTTHMPHLFTPRWMSQHGAHAGLLKCVLVEIFAVGYMLVTGLLQVLVLPHRATKENIFPFVLVDASSWVPPGAAMNLAACILALPYFHVIPAVRTLADTVSTILLRREARFIGEHAGWSVTEKVTTKSTALGRLQTKQRWLRWFVFLTVASMAANTSYRLYWLMVVCTCTVHVLYLFVGWRAKQAQDFLRPTGPRANPRNLVRIGTVAFTAATAVVWVSLAVHYLS